MSLSLQPISKNKTDKTPLISNENIINTDTSCNSCCISSICKPFWIILAIVSIVVYVTWFFDHRLVLILIIFGIYRIISKCYFKSPYASETKIFLVIYVFLSYIVFWFGYVYWAGIYFSVYLPILYKLYHRGAKSLLPSLMKDKNLCYTLKGKIIIGVIAFICFIIAFGVVIYFQYEEDASFSDSYELGQNARALFDLMILELFVPVFIMVSICQYKSILLSLIEIEGADQLFDTDIYVRHIKSIQQKIILSKIYVFLLILLWIQCIIIEGWLWYMIYDIHNMRLWEIRDKMLIGLDITRFLFLCLMSYYDKIVLIADNEWKCKECNTMNAEESKKCIFCSFEQNSNIDLKISDKHTTDNVMDINTISTQYNSISSQQMEYFRNPLTKETLCSNSVNLCPSFKRINILSKLFINADNPDQFCGEFNQLMSIGYSRIDLLNDCNHIITDHDINIMNANTIQCSCSKYNNRNRNYFNHNSLISYTQQIHFYIYHNSQQSNRNNRRQIALPRNMDSNNESQINICHKNNIDDTEIDKDDSKYPDNIDEQKVNVTNDNNNNDNDNNDNFHNHQFLYEFGIFMYYDLLRPKYCSFKQEMLQNDIASIDIQTWTIIYDESNDKLKTKKAKKYKKPAMQICDIMAIKCYTDLDVEQGKFRESFLNHIDKNENDRDVILRHCNNFYFWGKNLNYAISMHGEKIISSDTRNPQNVITLYHGLSKDFLFSTLSKDFNVPISMTTDMIVARIFAAYKGIDQGIIVELKPKYDNKLRRFNRTRALRVDWISSTPGEKEVLLFGNFNQLIIHNIISIENVQYKNELNAIRNFETIIEGIQVDADIFNILSRLINNEINKANIDNCYISKLFHHICINKQYFSIQSIIKNKRVLVVLNIRHLWTRN